jgi:hypothetical protein
MMDLFNKFNELFNVLHDAKLMNDTDDDMIAKIDKIKEESRMDIEYHIRDIKKLIKKEGE